MTDEKRYTERDMVLARRSAWADGRYSVVPSFGYDTCYAEAKARYPLPKVTRQRVVADPHSPLLSWKVIAGECRPRVVYVSAAYPDGNPAIASEFGAIHVTADRIALWADLLANPTETVEDES